MDSKKELESQIKESRKESAKRWCSSCGRESAEVGPAVEPQRDGACICRDCAELTIAVLDKDEERNAKD